MWIRVPQTDTCAGNIVHGISTQSSYRSTCSFSGNLTKTIIHEVQLCSWAIIWQTKNRGLIGIGTLCCTDRSWKKSSLLRSPQIVRYRMSLCLTISFDLKRSIHDYYEYTIDDDYNVIDYLNLLYTSLSMYYQGNISSLLRFYKYYDANASEFIVFLLML